LNNINEAFSIFDKNDDNGSLNINEMKHILSRIGDKCSEDELHSFFSMFDSGNGYCKL
jgi:Ca2+-binding EF-hand superfamily protein